MAFVKRAYSVVSLDELVAALERGGKLPPRALAITFDDGYADNHRLALPVLRALGLPATVYVATGSVSDAAPFWVGGGARARAVGARYGARRCRARSRSRSARAGGARGRRRRR